MKKKRSSTGSVFQKKRRDGTVKPGWYVRLRRDGVEVCRKGGDTPEEAQEELERLIADFDHQLRLSRAGITHLTFDEFAELFLEEAETVYSPTTIYGVRLKVRNQLIPAFKGKLLYQITQQDIRRYLSARARTGIANATYNGDLAQLSAIFRTAIEMGYAASNPVKGIKRRRPDEFPVPYLDQPSQRRLIEKCDERIRPVVMLALDSGMRLSELMRLEWRDVDIARGTVTVRKSKNRKSRVIPIDSRSVDMLRELRMGRIIPMKLKDRNRVFGWIHTTVREAWGTWCRRLYKKAVSAAGLPPLRFHDLRHCYAVDLVQAGVPLSVVATLMGHSQMVTTWRYAKHQPLDATYRAREILQAHRRGDGEGRVRESAWGSRYVRRCRCRSNRLGTSSRSKKASRNRTAVSRAHIAYPALRHR